jgi:hypothetical protein
MDKTLKTLIISIIGCFIYWVAFAKDVFLFEIFAWVILSMAYIGLCMPNVMKELAREVTWKNYLIFIPTVTFSLWCFFTNSAEVFGYCYILFILISQTMVINHKFKN